VERSLAELEYHADMARWMGYGKSKLDFKINVHLSGKLGVAGFDTAWQKMSLELRNCLTLENDEYQAGLDALLPLGKRVGIVLDIHHHFINTGEYINSQDHRISQVIDSWQGVKPAIHYSQSREDYIAKFIDIMPLMDQLLTITNKAKLRSHSDFYNNKQLNAWALTHLEWADIQTESKGKNLSADQLFNQWQESI
jgi:UV DNA damage repair endonuclease